MALVLFVLSGLVCSSLASLNSIDDPLIRGSNKLGRRLQQSARAIVLADPVSATVADLKDDPTGRGHLLVRRCDSEPVYHGLTR